MKEMVNGKKTYFMPFNKGLPDGQGAGDDFVPRFIHGDQLPVHIQHHAGAAEGDLRTLEFPDAGEGRMLPGNKLGQHFQDFATAEFVRDDHVEEAVIRLRVGNGLHAAADPAAVADGEDGHVFLFCLSVHPQMSQV